MTESTSIIAIDGPAGSGKSTTARMVARKLNFIFLDTGAMYRTVTLLALENNLDLDDVEELIKITNDVVIEFKDSDEGQKVFANDRDVTLLIRTPEVTSSVSQVSAYPEVRRILVERQKEFGRKYNLVAEGRDTTSVVFPDATLKVYLVASVEERARRRVLEFKHNGKKTTLEEQVELIKARDAYDSGRQASPLTQTSDSVLVDTTNLSIDKQVMKIVKLYHERVNT